MPIDYNNIGTGADGAIVYGAGVHTLTADVNATSLWVQSGATVITANWRIFCRGTIKIDGLVHNDGRDAIGPGGGSDTSTDLTGSLPVLATLFDIHRTDDWFTGPGNAGIPAVDGDGDGMNGGVGGAGGNTANALPAGKVFYSPGPPAQTVIIPGNGVPGGSSGQGGQGGSSESLTLDSFLNSVPPVHSGTGGAGGSRGPTGTITSSATLDVEALLETAYSSPASLSSFGLPSAPGGAGGGGGGGSSAYGVGAAGYGGVGGGRGGHGGWVVLFAKQIIISSTGAVRSIGGRGGNGTVGAGPVAFTGHMASGGGGGGGTAGNGGAVILASEFLTNDSAVPQFSARGGAGGPRGPSGVDSAEPTGSTSLPLPQPEAGKDGADGGDGIIIFRALFNTAVVIGHGVNCNDYPPIAASAGSFVAPGNGSLIEDLEPMRSWCRANGISVALVQDSQRSAKDLIDELLTIGNSAPVYSGDKVKIVPYDEVSGAGYGGVYIAPTAAGPIANLTDQDFALDKNGNVAPVKFTRKRRTDCDNVVAIEYVERSLDYARNVVSELDQKAVAMFGPRKGGTLSAAELGVNTPSGSKALLAISSGPVAQAIASILAKRSAAGVNEWSFALKQEWLHLEAMDLVTISDTRLGLVSLAVRLKSVKETDKRTLDCVADEFIYGLNHPSPKVLTSASGSIVKSNVSPGLVNPPIIFQPPQAMLPAGGTPQIWFLVSGMDPNYGGCIAFLSLDGGLSYPTMLGSIGPASTGVLTADYPSGPDPDVSDVLAVDLSESNGSIATQSQATADNFADPSFVAGTAAFEAVCATIATLTSAEHYSLDTYIRRGTLGTAVMDHPAGSRFGVIDGATFKIDLPASWVGRTLYFKFAAYNKTFGQQNNLADCVPYPFTPVGSFAPGGFYVNGA